MRLKYALLSCPELLILSSLEYNKYQFWVNVMTHLLSEIKQELNNEYNP